MIDGVQYPYKKEFTATSERFEFVSTGPKGDIIKAAQFTYMFEGIYNFGFGDWDSTEKKINDTKLSRNNDAQEVLNTLGSIIKTFTTIHWNAYIFVMGNTPIKHRWYQMNINKHLNEIEYHFDLWGQVGHRWLPYEKGKIYTAFLAIRRNGGFSFYLV